MLYLLLALAPSVAHTSRVAATGLLPGSRLRLVNDSFLEFLLCSSETDVFSQKDWSELSVSDLADISYIYPSAKSKHPECYKHGDLVHHMQLPENTIADWVPIPGKTLDDNGYGGGPGDMRYTRYQLLSRNVIDASAALLMSGPGCFELSEIDGGRLHRLGALHGRFLVSGFHGQRPGFPIKRASRSTRCQDDMAQMGPSIETFCDEALANHKYVPGCMTNTRYARSMCDKAVSSRQILVECLAFESYKEAMRDEIVSQCRSPTQQGLLDTCWSINLEGNFRRYWCKESIEWEDRCDKEFPTAYRRVFCLAHAARGVSSAASEHCSDVEEYQAALCPVTLGNSFADGEPLSLDTHCWMLSPEYRSLFCMFKSDGASWSDECAQANELQGEFLENFCRVDAAVHGLRQSRRCAKLQWVEELQARDCAELAVDAKKKCWSLASFQRLYCESLLQDLDSDAPDKQCWDVEWFRKRTRDYCRPRLPKPGASIFDRDARRLGSLPCFDLSPEFRDSYCARYKDDASSDKTCWDAAGEDDNTESSYRWAWCTSPVRWNGTYEAKCGRFAKYKAHWEIQCQSKAVTDGQEGSWQQACHELVPKDYKRIYCKSVAERQHISAQCAEDEGYLSVMGDQLGESCQYNIEKTLFEACWSINHHDYRKRWCRSLMGAVWEDRCQSTFPDSYLSDFCAAELTLCTRSLTPKMDDRCMQDTTYQANMESALCLGKADDHGFDESCWKNSVAYRQVHCTANLRHISRSKRIVWNEDQGNRKCSQEYEEYHEDWCIAFAWTRNLDFPDDSGCEQFSWPQELISAGCTDFDYDSTECWALISYQRIYCDAPMRDPRNQVPEPRCNELDWYKTRLASYCKIQLLRVARRADFTCYDSDEAYRIGADDFCSTPMGLFADGCLSLCSRDLDETPTFCLTDQRRLGRSAQPLMRGHAACMPSV